MATIEMFYGDYSLVPVPLITFSKEDSKTDSGKLIGTLLKIQLQGTLTTLPGVNSGLVLVDALQDAMRAAFDRDGKHFTLKCDGQTIIDGYPRISQNVQFNTSTDNWVMSCPYTIELEFDDEPGNNGENAESMPPYIFSANESWTVEFEQDRNRYFWTLDSGSLPDASPYVLRMTHNVSAVGKMHYYNTGEATGNLEKEAWEQAKMYVVSRLGFDNNHLVGSGIINLDASIFGQYNHIRNQSIEEANGSFSVEENWLVVSSGSGIAHSALEDFTITNRSSVDSALSTLSIEGSIQGLERRTYGSSPGQFNIVETKYESALAYWEIVKHRLFYRAQHVAENDLNINSIANSIGHNPVAGTITYSYEYDDRPCNYIGNSISEVIAIRDSNPIDEFARIVIPGRAYGPILQGLNTISEFSRSVSIDILVPPPSGCNNIMTAINSSPRSGIQELLCDVEQDLESSYSQVYKTQDEESWEPKRGSYSRNITWVAVKCSGTAPNTSMCS